MTTATRNNTRPVAAYIRQSDEVARLAAELKAAEQQLQQLEAAAIAALPESDLLVLTVDGKQRTAKLGSATSYKLTVDAPTAVEFARRHGLKVTTQPAEVLSGATLRSAATKGLDVSEIADSVTAQSIIIG